MNINTQQKKALKKLNDAITNLPEFRDVMLLVPSNVAITDCELVECDQTQYFHKKAVKYEGIVPNQKGKHPYLLQCCGLAYFESDKSIKELADDIAEAYTKVKAVKTIKPDMVSLNIFHYLIANCSWDMTDEVYPHMRTQAIGAFSLPKLKD